MLKVITTTPSNAATNYRPLDEEFDNAIIAIARCLMPQGFEVSEDAPRTLESLIEEFEPHRKMKVWSGASGLTIYGSPNVNFAFRAWHDWCHYNGRHPFNLAGEAAVCMTQMQQIVDIYGDTNQTRRWCSFIMCDVLGQSMFEKVQGGFPVDQQHFVRQLDGLISNDQAELPFQ